MKVAIHCGLFSQLLKPMIDTSNAVSLRASLVTEKTMRIFECNA